MADDHTLVLEGIRKLLENEFELVGTVEDGRALLRAAEQLRPDVILLDISMPLLNGIEACRQLVKLTPKARVIFLTMHTDVVYVEEAFRADHARLNSELQFAMIGVKFPVFGCNGQRQSKQGQQNDPYGLFHIFSKRGLTRSAYRVYHFTAIVARLLSTPFCVITTATDPVRPGGTSRFT